MCMLLYEIGVTLCMCMSFFNVGVTLCISFTIAVFVCIDHDKKLHNRNCNGLCNRLALVRINYHSMYRRFWKRTRLNDEKVLRNW